MKDNYTELYEKLSKLQWLLQRYRMATRAECGPFADTTRGQGRVMAALTMQSEISTKDLSYLLGIRIPSLNELLNKLEKSGYIRRSPSEADKRVMLIQLTEKGKEAQIAETDYSDIFDCLNDEEQKAFGDYLDRVIDALEAQVGDMPDEAEMQHWMKGARSRMGDERFDRFMRQGFRGRGGFGPRGRGSAPEDMPGAERFDPDYDGPMPDGRDFPCGWGADDNAAPGKDETDPQE